MALFEVVLCSASDSFDTSMQIDVFSYVVKHLKLLVILTRTIIH